MSFVTVSYFSDLDESAYYRRSAERLVAALEQFQLEHEVEEIPSRGSYRENCTYKPLFILKQLVGCRYPCPLD